MTARILIVDDVPVNTKLLHAKLAAEYYQVEVAQDGFEALRVAHAWQPDLILLDVMMPGMDGYQTCRRLKSDSQTMHIPVVMITALGDATERLHGLEVGADDFLTKPVDYDTLLARVRGLRHRISDRAAIDTGRGPDPDHASAPHHDSDPASVGHWNRAPVPRRRGGVAGPEAR